MKFKNLNDAAYHFLKELQIKEQNLEKIISTNSQVKDSYKEEIVELTQQFYEIENANDLMINNSVLKQHSFWAISELMTEILAINPPIMDKYSPQIMEWSYNLKPNRKARYLYGCRWEEFDQLFNTFNKFKKNPNTKKAVISIYSPYDTNPEYADVPCTLMYHFLLRDKKMDMTTFYRSHDLFSGFKYDALLSGFVLNSLCSWLRAEDIDVQPGKLFFFDGSLHYYPKKDGDKLLTAIESHSSDILENKISVITNNISVDNYFKQLRLVQDTEAAAHYQNMSLARKISRSIQYQPFRYFAETYIKKNEK